MRTLIANGTIVTAEGSYPADVLVDGERIVQVGTALGTSATADETIDASGRYVIPGGIDGHIFRAMQRTAKNGGLIMMHAENGMAIDVIAADTVAAGTTDPIGHGLARYSVLEGEATNRVIRLAQAARVPVYIVHLSAREALNVVRMARDEGLPAFAETCPQYLFLSLDDLGNGFEGAKFVCSPPLRTKDHQPELWNGLVKDDLQLVSTDHCPFDFHGQKDLGKGDFRKIPNGLPGVEDRVDLLHDGGVVAGRISRERCVEIISTAAANLFGMYPQKGAIAVRYDASHHT